MGPLKTFTMLAYVKRSDLYYSNAVPVLKTVFFVSMNTNKTDNFAAAVRFSDEKETLAGKPVYLHMGHLIDRTGYMAFKERVLRDVTLNEKAEVAQRIY